MEKIITEFQKNALEKIRIKLNVFKGKQICDLRSWVIENPTKPNEVKPTKKGISLQPGQLNDVIQGLQEAQKALSEND